MSFRRAAGDRLGQASIRARMSAHGAPLWIATAPDIAPLSENGLFSPCFSGVFESLRGNFVGARQSVPMRQPAKNAGFFMLTLQSGGSFALVRCLTVPLGVPLFPPPLVRNVRPSFAGSAVVPLSQNARSTKRPHGQGKFP